MCCDQQNSIGLCSGHPVGGLTQRLQGLAERLRVYVITDASLVPGRGHLDIIRAAVAGGAGTVQLRDKRATARELYTLAKEAFAICRAAGAMLIINDRPDVAIAAGADGVHIGEDDIPASEARRLLDDAARRLGGGRMVLGVSAGSAAEAVAAEAAGADYVGVGPVFATATKPDAGAPIGTEGVRSVKRSVRIPVVAIGGITVGNTPDVIAAGADGLAVVSAVVKSRDMAAAVAELMKLWGRFGAGCGKGRYTG